METAELIYLVFMIVLILAAILVPLLIIVTRKGSTFVTPTPIPEPTPNECLDLQSFALTQTFTKGAALNLGFGLNTSGDTDWTRVFYTLPHASPSNKIEVYTRATPSDSFEFHTEIEFTLPADTEMTLVPVFAVSRDGRFIVVPLQSTGPSELRKLLVIRNNPITNQFNQSVHTLDITEDKTIAFKNVQRDVEQNFFWMQRRNPTTGTWGWDQIEVTDNGFPQLHQRFEFNSPTGNDVGFVMGISKTTLTIQGGSNPQTDSEVLVYKRSAIDGPVTLQQTIIAPTTVPGVADPKDGFGFLSAVSRNGLYLVIAISQGSDFFFLFYTRDNVDSNFTWTNQVFQGPAPVNAANFNIQWFQNDYLFIPMHNSSSVEKGIIRVYKRTGNTLTLHTNVTSSSNSAGTLEFGGTLNISENVTQDGAIWLVAGSQGNFTEPYFIDVFKGNC